MARGRLRLPRPDPETPYRVLVRSSQVQSDWDEMLKTRRRACIALWDHISSQPNTSIGSRYLPLTGTQAFVEYAGQQLRQWQYEIDHRARVRVGVGPDFVVVVAVSSGHPKENE